MAKYELIDCKPVPVKLAAEIRGLKTSTGATLNSCLRTQDAVNFARRHGCHLHSQAELWHMAQTGQGNPANPPGRSTHEQRSDGVAFVGPPGRPLRYWQVGMDWSKPGPVAAAARRRGWVCTITYPHSRGEAQHLNFRKEPFLHRVLKPLRHGSTGTRVKVLTRRLMFVHSPVTDKPYLDHKTQTFTAAVENALKQFQRDHHLKPDGVFGGHTAAQLAASVRWRKQHH